MTSIVKLNHPAKPVPSTKTPTIWTNAPRMQKSRSKITNNSTFSQFDSLKAKNSTKAKLRKRTPINLPAVGSKSGQLNKTTYYSIKKVKRIPNIRNTTSWIRNVYFSSFRISGLILFFPLRKKLIN